MTMSRFPVNGYLKDLIIAMWMPAGNDMAMAGIFALAGGPSSDLHLIQHPIMQGFSCRQPLQYAADLMHCGSNRGCDVLNFAL